jgi:hypothetical protein
MVHAIFRAARITVVVAAAPLRSPPGLICVKANLNETDRGWTHRCP